MPGLARQRGGSKGPEPTRSGAVGPDPTARSVSSAKGSSRSQLSRIRHQALESLGFSAHMLCVPEADEPASERSETSIMSKPDIAACAVQFQMRGITARMS